MIRLEHIILLMNINLQYILTFFAFIMPQRISVRIFHLREKFKLQVCDELRKTISSYERLPNGESTELVLLTIEMK